MDLELHGLANLEPEITRVANRKASVLIRGPVGTELIPIAQHIHDLDEKRGLFSITHLGEMDPKIDKSGGNGLTLCIGEVEAATSRVRQELLKLVDREDLDMRVILTTHTAAPLASKKSFMGAIDRRHRDSTITVPPIQKRPPEAIEKLALHLLSEFSDEKIVEIEASAAEVIKNFPWPGNVDQLRAVIRRACDGVSASILNGKRKNHKTGITRKDLVTYGGIDSFVEQHYTYSFLETVKISLKMHSKEEKLPSGWTRTEILDISSILATVVAFGGNKTQAAEFLGISRRSIYNKLDPLQERYNKGEELLKCMNDFIKIYYRTLFGH